MKRVINYLREKWGIKSIYRLWLIIFIFAISGTTTLFIKEPVFYLFNIGEHTEAWIKTSVYILAVLPGYFLILMLYAILLGELGFFIDFVKKTFMKMNLKRYLKKSS
jgi:hypothetical protein